MKKHYLLSILLGFMLANALPVFAEDSPPVFKNDRYYEDFQIKDKFEGKFYKELEKKVNASKPNVGGGVYHSFTLPAEYTANKTEEEIDRDIYRALLSFSTQEGIEYYSNSRGYYRIFIEKSYVVKSPDDLNRLDDPRDFPLPLEPETRIYSYQEDSSFGNGVKEINVKYDKDTHQFYIEISNLSPIKYKGLITVAEPKEFFLNLVISREGNEVKIYGLTYTQSKTFGAIKKKVSKSIVYRIYALAQWFERETLVQVKQ